MKKILKKAALAVCMPVNQGFLGIINHFVIKLYSVQ